MLYNYVNKILDKGKEKDVDLLVARDMLFADASEDEVELLKNACEVLTSGYYEVITTLRREGREVELEEFCGYIEEDNRVAIREKMKALGL